MGLRYDIHAKLTPNGAALYTDVPVIRGSKKVIVQHLANGSGDMTIPRNSPAATTAIIARGNWVKVYLTELSTTEPIFTWQLESGDFDVISGDEEGGEHLTFGGPGNRSYMKNARLWTTHFMGANPINASRPTSWHWYNDQYGDIWKRLLDEDSARPTPTMPALTYDWTSTLDSAGNPWPSFSGDFYLDIGLNYEEALSLMEDYDDLFVRMSANFLMQGYASEYGIDRSSASFAAGKVRFVKGDNIKGDLERNIYGPVRYTHVIVQGAPDEDGNPTYVTVVDPAYVEGQERREGYLQHGETNSLPQLQAAGLKLITVGEKNEDAVAWTGTIRADNELNGDYIPGPAALGGHFFEGDFVTLYTGAGAFDYNNKKVQVMSITYIELDNGQVDYIIEGDGSITAGSSGLGGDLEGDPGGEDCCGKPGTGIVSPPTVGIPTSQVATTTECDPADYTFGTGYKGCARNDGTYEAEFTLGLTNERFSGVGPSTEYDVPGCPGAGGLGGAEGGERIQFGLAEVAIVGTPCTNVAGAYMTLNFDNGEICTTLPPGQAGDGWVAGQGTVCGAAVFGGYQVEVFKGRTASSPAKDDILAGGVVIGSFGGTLTGSIRLFVPADLIDFTDGCRLLVRPMFGPSGLFACTQEWFDGALGSGHVDISITDIEVHQVADGAQGRISLPISGTRDGVNTSFVAIGGYSQVHTVYRNGIALADSAWSTDAGTPNIETIGWAPLATDLIEAEYTLE